jgi:hypothetical protein
MRVNDFEGSRLAKCTDFKTVGLRIDATLRSPQKEARHHYLPRGTISKARVAGESESGAFPSLKSSAVSQLRVPVAAQPRSPVVFPLSWDRMTIQMHLLFKPCGYCAISIDLSKVGFSQSTILIVRSVFWNAFSETLSQQ